MTSTSTSTHPLRGDVLAIRRKTAMVFQQYNLFRNMTALDNVAAGLVVTQKVPKRRPRSAEEALVRVGLSDKLGAYPGRLSGGQQQRVGIARAMALSPRIILFDEPTSLDPELVGEVLQVIRQVATGRAMLIVSHEMNFVRRIAHRVIFMEGGVIVEQGPRTNSSPTRPRSARRRSKARDRRLSYSI